MASIQTVFSGSVDRACPLPEHPRPGFYRDCWMNLNGEWDYTVTGHGAQVPNEFHGTILVPYAIETQLSGVERTFTGEEILWYRRGFTVPGSFAGKRVLLHFGAVDWECVVYLNGETVGTHRGGYNAFTFDITGLLREGENELKVRVYDPSDRGWQQRGKQAIRSHGFWYTATSGIWQTVWLEGVAEDHIEDLKITPDIDTDSVRLSAKAARGEITAEIFDGETLLASAVLQGETAVQLASYECWSPENPKLYDLVLTLRVDGEVTDTVRSYFGMRKFSMAKDEKGYLRLCLNGKPYFQNGLLDQGYWPESGLTAPSDEAMIYDIRTMKELGFNMLRKHIKVEPERWYYHCDRIGMLVWQDMVSGGKELNPVHAGVIPNVQGVFIPVAAFSVKDNKYKTFNRGQEEWRLEFTREMTQTIRQLYNFTSICTWVPFNEGWGQFDALAAEKTVRALDGTRFVDHASGWYDQGGGDFRSIHRYIMPVQIPKREENRAFVLSEFGGYSQVLDGHVWNKARSFGYMMFRTKTSLTNAYRRLFEKQIIPAIEKGLSATVYTQVSDVEFEVNGILSYDRKVIKVDEQTLRSINARMKL